MIAGILEIWFKENAKQEDIDMMLSEFYIQNESEIKGMEWKQFDGLETLVEICEVIDKRIKELDEQDKL